MPDMLAIYDTMQFIVHCDIVTVCIGEAASAAGHPAAGGTRQRAALLNATILIHQPHPTGAFQGQVSDLRSRPLRSSASVTGSTMRSRPVIPVSPPTRSAAIPTRDNILTAAQAKEYGIVDEV